ncbi:SAM-dependent DNA methyltransferase [Vibrio parahaemolyticus]|nr:SAM-dependent DNA methyltransferase [Vibrio parahaemolyticus]
MSSSNFQQLSNFIWSIADLIRGPYRPPQYERVMLPLTVLRRFDAVLAPTKQAVLSRYEVLKDKDSQACDSILNQIAKNEKGEPLGFHNHSRLDFQKLKGDPDNIGRHLTDYINGFSENVRKIFERFDFEKEIEKMEDADILYLVVSQFTDIDLHPNRVDNITMGLVFEDLIRRFNESANETAGDHFTPREVIRLMVNLLLEPDTEVLTQAGIIVTLCDPTCGTGGMLAEGQSWIRDHNEEATVKVYGQDYNPRSYAVAASDLLIKGHRDSRIEYGNTLTDDQFENINSFDYLIANPPFGVDWKGEKKQIDRLPSFHGYQGKLPRVNDGALLFLLYMLGKFAPYEEGNKDKSGSRAAVVFNGSPLFTGGAGSGESDIRRWIIEQDLLEAVIALPEQMFYNTGIGTYIWVLSNRKQIHRQGKIQLIDARERWAPMKRNLGNKRRWLDQDDIDAISCEHGGLVASDTSKVFDNQYFGYRRVTILRPLRLRFQLTEDAKERFLFSFPELFDLLSEIENRIGIEPVYDWNIVWEQVQVIVKNLPDEFERWSKGAKGTAQKKAFREAFTQVDEEAAPVINKVYKKLDLNIPALFPHQELSVQITNEQQLARLGLYVQSTKGKTQYLEYESDPKLKDYENIPLQQGVLKYVEREVIPYVADAWIDRNSLDELDSGIGKVGYEINFNREFLRFQSPRKLSDIDAELEAVEKQIMTLLQEVME